MGEFELITPETKHTVEQALAKGDWSTVESYSRFLGPILQRISAQDPALARQIEQFRRSNPRCQ
ncbi:MAG: hypothetical protein ABSF22_19395 [Bryobacteraceae bacterium]